ncbi:uncharacterized protein G2W53_029905 [Senna tora]|uniref:Viral late gene transcription factor 3 zinc ribbon domain-containing protein n=1 Tax=Senna tora TaxID=362788 RepID=A0A834T6H8_9FABA|nr:uncharacterized protein G2W53_029905 [Senna tora]
MACDESFEQWLSGLLLLAMEASLSSSSSSSCVLSLTSHTSHSRRICLKSKPTLHFPLSTTRNFLVNNARKTKTVRRTTSSIAASINDVQTILDPAPVDVTWQIVVGAIAGVTPFVVAGVEFSKRIIAQKRCEECGGSGLVLREKEYFRCPECGGFLPWQSWKRFFSG